MKDETTANTTDFSEEILALNKEAMDMMRVDNFQEALSLLKKAEDACK